MADLSGVRKAISFAVLVLAAGLVPTLLSSSGGTERSVRTHHAARTGATAAAGTGSVTGAAREPAFPASAGTPMTGHPRRAPSGKGRPGTGGAGAAESTATSATPAGAAPSTAGPARATTTPGEQAGSGFEIGERIGTSSLQIGVTHTQHSADTWGDATAVAAARGLLEQAPLSQNQHIMGWGALNPHPAPGVYDWRSLDSRVALMLATTATPTITFAGAPDWMKGGLPGETDWAKLEVAPLRAHYADFAALAAKVAKRYPTIRRFQVWNELKGFHDPATNRWDAVAYTDMYNLVHAAVKSARPDALIGGPYVVMDSWSTRSVSHPSALQGPWGVADQRPLDVLSYWLEHAVDADFISVDGSTRTRDEGLITDPFTAVQKYVDIHKWLRARTSLPIVWSEWYPASDVASIEKQSAVTAYALSRMATIGVSSVLWWGPQGPIGCSACLWTDTRLTGGGGATRLYAAVAGFAQHFGPGTELFELRPAASGVSGLASDSTVMVVNHTGGEVALPGAAQQALAPYEVRFIAR